MIRGTLRRRSLLAVAVGLILTTSLFAASPSQASGSPSGRGNCSGPSAWKLVVDHQDSALRVRFEVQGGKSGQKWHVFLSDDGFGIFAGSRITGHEGHFEVRARTADRAGKDKVRAEANNLTTGETCSGRATF